MTQQIRDLCDAYARAKRRESMAEYIDNYNDMHRERDQARAEQDRIVAEIEKITLTAATCPPERNSE